MESVAGKLLIAGPTVRDPNFWRTVVLVVDHGDDGALGLVLNRPSDTTIADAVPELDELIDGDEELFIGGPVQPSGVIVLAHFTDPAAAAMIAFDDVGVLGVGAGDSAPDSVDGARAFVGHAGWGPGQLDAELERGDWFLEPAASDDAFSAAPLELWSTVLTRKGGSYALVARMPAEPSLN